MNIYFLFLQNRRTGGQNKSCLGDWYQWEGEDVGKGCKRRNMVQILCTHVFKWSMRPVEIMLGVGQRRIKENGGGGELNYDIFYFL
jgi:hypothetical protein